MVNALSPAVPTGTSDWHGLTKREYVAIKAMSALIKAYGASNAKDPNHIKMLPYQYSDAMLSDEPPLAK